MTGTATPIHGGSHRNLQPAAPSPLATGCVLLLSVLVAALTVAAYWPVLQCGFVNYDDPLYVTANPHVQAGLTWPNVGWAFTAHHASNWHPVTWLSHMVDCQSFGLNPAGHHLVSLLLHLANTLLLFGLLNRLTRSCWPSALVALWFGVHPTHVESVAWVAERKDVLSTLFFLLTLWAYARYAEESNVSESASTANHASRATHYQPLAGPSSRRHLPATIYYLLSLGLFALGLMTKPMLVTLPFVLLLLDYWPLRRIAFPALQHSGTAALHSPHHSATPILFLIREKLPFFLLALLSCGTPLWAQASAGSVISMEAFPLAHRVANALLSCVRYVEQTFWPAHLAVFYSYEGPAPAWLVLGAGVALLTVTAATIRARKCPWLAVGWLWFVGTLVPVIGLVQVGTQAMADRYLYIPSIGLFIVAAFGLSELAARFRFGTMALAMLAGLTLAGCLLATRRQVLYWRDSETLLRHALAVRQLSPPGPTSVTINNPLTLNANGGNDIDLTAATGNTFTLGGPISGPGYLTVGRADAPVGTVVLSGNNTYVGPTTINAGTMQLGSSTALGGGFPNPVAIATPAAVAGSFLYPVQVNASGILDLNAQTIGNSISLNGGQFVNNNASPAIVNGSPSGGVKVFFTSAGTGVSGGSTIAITGGGGSGATATASLGVTTASFTLNAGGSGYSGTLPTVAISGGGGSGATATVSRGVTAASV